MKSPWFLFCLLIASVPSGANAQYSARQLTRKIVPQPQQQQPIRPNQPVQPAPAAPTSQVARPAVAAQPESERVRANRDEAARKAVEFQKKRAEEGSPQAQYDLGVRYLKGNGVEKNDALGREWLQKSAENGSIHAQRKLDELPKLAPSATLAAPGTLAQHAAIPSTQDALKQKERAPLPTPSKN